MPKRDLGRVLKSSSKEPMETMRFFWYPQFDWLQMSLDVPVANDGLYQQQKPIILTSLFEIPWRKGTIPSMISKHLFEPQASKQGGQDTLKFGKT